MDREIFGAKHLSLNEQTAIISTGGWGEITKIINLRNSLRKVKCKWKKRLGKWTEVNATRVGGNTTMTSHVLRKVCFVFYLACSQWRG
jgi:hypothetical protein